MEAAIVTLCKALGQILHANQKGPTFDRSASALLVALTDYIRDKEPPTHSRSS